MSFVLAFLPLVAAVAVQNSAAAVGGAATKYNLDSDVTVSGLSSGGFMSAQFAVAYSSHVTGFGVFAGGPYYCAQDSITNALSDCMSNSVLLDVNQLVTETQGFASAGQIDALSNLANMNVFLYSGSADYTVNPTVVQALQQQLQQLGVNNITTQYTINSGHCIPTMNYGGSCSGTQSPFLNDCGYDGVGAMLNVLYSNLKPRVPKQTGGPFTAIDVAKYVPSGWTPSSASLGDQFFLYASPQCSNGTRCSLHIAFHGCEQSINDIGKDFVQHAGYINWAVSNNLLVLFPQAVSSSNNPESCFDWWGFTDSNYAFNNSAQMLTVRNVAKALGAFY